MISDARGTALLGQYDHAGLFEAPGEPIDTSLEETLDTLRPTAKACPPRCTIVTANVGIPTLEVFERARDPSDPLELRDLFISRVESELGPLSFRPEMAERWNESRPRRRLTAEDVLRAQATPRFVKEIFNFFFRDDLYGSLRSDQNLILSSGAADETVFGLIQPLRECIEYALRRGWYGYSDSRGRAATRDAIARYESARVPGAETTAEGIAITMGGTFAMNVVADFWLTPRPSAPALCLVPNYPPLVEAVARRSPIELVPTSSGGGFTDLQPLIDALRPDTPLVMFQTVTNPTGCRVDEAEIERLIHAAGPNTLVVLDEAHECWGPPIERSAARGARNVVRLVSLSKSLFVPGLKLGWIAASPEFMVDFYEHASTSYGGPPSIFFLLLEVAARFDRWVLEGLSEPTVSELHEFEPHYGLRLDNLCRAYRQYLQATMERRDRILSSRAWFEDALADQGLQPVRADYSLNIALRVSDVGSYEYFRRTLSRTKVAVYPGVLNFLFDDPSVRMTSVRSPHSLIEAVGRLSDDNRTVAMNRSAH